MAVSTEKTTEKKAPWVELAAIIAGSRFRGKVSLAPATTTQQSRVVTQFESSIPRKGYGFSLNFLRGVSEALPDIESAAVELEKLASSARGWLSKSADGEILKTGAWVVDLELKEAGASQEEYKSKLSGVQLVALRAKTDKFSYYHPKDKVWYSAPELVGEGNVGLAVDESIPDYPEETPPVE